MRQRHGGGGKWHSLTKSVGKSQKDTLDSGGSFGIGKHAAFAATDIRTVLYSTAYTSNGGSNLEYRFTGKTILVSHTLGDKRFRSVGWLADQFSDPIRNESVPTSFRLKSPGTQVSILGFDKARWENEWKKQTLDSVITHFFHALTQENLIVRLDGLTIDRRAVDELSKKMGDRIQSLVEVSKAPIVASNFIEGIGTVNLRIMVDYEGLNPNKALAIVRDAGMMITDRLGSMKRSRSQRMISFPRSWRGFTAIIECLSEGKRSFLRDAEGPRHDLISPDNADELERKEVRAALKELGTWARSEIEKLAKPPEPSDVANASEMAKFIPLSADGGESSESPGQGRFEITEPQQSRKPPRGIMVPATRRTAQKFEPGGKTPNPGNPDQKGKRTRKRMNRQPVEVPLNNIRRLPAVRDQWPEHTARFAFSLPSPLPKRIRLYAAVEDGTPAQIPLERAYIGDRRIKVRKGEIVDLPENLLTEDRVYLEVKAIRPISDKRLEIRPE